MRVRKNVWAPIIILIATLIVASPIILNKTAVLGVDSYFHYNRIYEAAMQLRNHNFSFLNLYSFQQSGRIINQLYSPLLTYICGGILLLAGNWLRFQIISIILVSFIAGYSLYHGARRLALPFKTSIALGVVYLSSFSIYSFIFGSNWRALALAFLPLLIGPIVDFYRGDWTLRSMLSLGVIIGIITQAQIMTTALILPILVPFFIIGLVRSQRKLRSLGYLVVAIFLALILSLNVVMPYLAVTGGDTLLPPVKIPLVQGVTNLVVPFVDHSTPLSISILCLVFYFAMAGLICFWKKATWMSRLLLIIAAIYIILGTTLVPWQQIDDSWPMLGRYLQLPRRFTIIGISFLILGAASLFRDILDTDSEEQINDRVGLIASVMAVASVLSLAVAVANTVGMYQNPTVKLSQGLGTTDTNVNSVVYQGKKVTKIVQIQPAFHTSNLSTLIRIVARTTPDYVPIKKVDNHYSYYNGYNKYVVNHYRKYKHTVNKGGIMTMTWTNRGRAKQQQIPVVAYKQTKVTLNGKVLKHSSFKPTKLGTIKVKSQHGKNTLKLVYTPRKSSILGIWIAMIAWIGVAVVSLGRIFKRRKVDQI